MEDIKKNPWLGLQTYKEGDVLYGRDDDIRNLSQYILTDSETVLFGKSGIGKSSVLNAGVIPMARVRGIVPVNIRLAHDSEAEPYTIQIYNKIKAAGIYCGEIKDGMQLWELFHSNYFKNEKGERVKLLIIFDQFEEIFTLQQNAQKKIEFFKELANHVNDVMPRSLSGETHSDSNYDELEEIKLKEKEEGTEIILDNMDFSLSEKSADYSHDNDIHIVLTLREDFLSEFEYYTSAIPSFKQHRYGLRPISEEQAAEIIQKPRQGLVSKEVAKLIIEKVTKRTDFKLDGKPEIEVNTAVLSLYLSKFYDKSGGMPFTKELIENEAGNIINEFYSECIKDIPEEITEKIETELVNKEGHRENKSLRGLSDELNAGNYINKLINQKLLSTFQYAGETKVEFIHDILCDVVQNRKEQKEKRKEEEKERLRLKKQNRINKIKLYGVSFILIMALFTIVYLAINNNQLKNEKGFGEHQEFTIKFVEDSMVIKDNEFWHAHFLFVAINGNKKDTIFNNHNFNKSLKDSTFRFSVDSIKTFYILLDFDKGANKKFYKKIEDNIPISYFTNNKEYKLHIKFDNDRMKSYEGKVVAKIDDYTMDLQNIRVILRTQTALTDSTGAFKLTFEKALTSEDVIYLVHEDFRVIKRAALDSLENNSWKTPFIMIPSDSTARFKLKCEVLNAIKKWDYQINKGVKVQRTDGSADYLFFYAIKNGKTENDNFVIKGYYYYNDWKALDDDKKYLSYHLFTGWMDYRDQGTKRGPIEKPFKVESYDKVGNRQVLTGWRTKPMGQIKGFIINMNDTIAAFGKCIK